MKSQYGTTKVYIGIMNLIGGLLFIFGTIAFIFILFGGDRDTIDIIKSLSVAIFGLMTIVGAELTKAVIDTADNTHEILLHLKSS